MSSSTVLGWRVWYTDESVYESRTHSWADLPEDGFALGMIYYEDGNKRICMGDNHYWEQDGVIFHNSDPLDITRQRYPDAVIKFGRWMEDSAFNALLEVARTSDW